MKPRLSFWLNLLVYIGFVRWFVGRRVAFDTGVLARNWGLEVVTPILLIVVVLLLILHEALLAIVMKTAQEATA